MSSSLPSPPAWPVMRWHSLRIQVTAWNVATLAVLLGLLGGVVHYVVHSMMLKSVDRDLALQARRFLGEPPPPRLGRFEGPRRPFQPPRLAPARPDTLAPLAAPPRNEGLHLPASGDLPAIRPGPPGEEEPRARGRMERPYPPRLFDLQGRLLRPADAAEPWDARAFALAAQGRESYSTLEVDGEWLRVLSLRFPARGPQIGVVQTAYPLTEVKRALAGLDAALLTLIPVALFCAGLGGSLLTRRVLRPIAHFSQMAARISARDPSERLPVTGKDEFSELAGTFNSMLERLENAFRQQERLLEQLRRFTADASHELRTPLTAIKANTTLCLGGSPSLEE